jgi:hypothetical protein
MRTTKGLSPTSLHLWENDRDEFYLKYLADNKRPDSGQTEAMAVGSAFDAYVKAALHKDLFGNDDGGKYSVDFLLLQQVDPVCMPFAIRAGKECLDCYVACRCYDELLRDMEKSTKTPRFEFTLYGEAGGVPLMGKPDCWYHNTVDVTLDWKVEGFCSAHPTSPKKLHKTCRDTWVPSDTLKATRGGGEPKPHKDYLEMDHHGHTIGSHWLEDVDKKWADQIAIYSWLLGMPVGDEKTVTCIDQLACKPNPLQGTEERLHPLIRVAQHRCRISPEWQLSLLGRLQSCWASLQTGHIFDELPRSESDERCELLDMQIYSSGGGEQDELWAMMNERQYRG